MVVGLASAATLAYRALHPHHYRAPLFLTDKQFRLLHLHPDTPGTGPFTRTTTGPPSSSQTSSSVSFTCTQAHQVQGPPPPPLQGPPLPHRQAVPSPSPAPRHTRYRALHPHHYTAPLFLTDKQFRLLHLHPDTPGTGPSTRTATVFPSPLHAHPQTIRVLTPSPHHYTRMRFAHRLRNHLVSSNIDFSFWLLQCVLVLSIYIVN